jgi:hypothetical protein
MARKITKSKKPREVTYLYDRNQTTFDFYLYKDGKEVVHTEDYTKFREQLINYVRKGLEDGTVTKLSDGKKKQKLGA